MRLALATVLVFLLAVPAAGAQTPADGCVRQCAPQDRDVNESPTRDGGPVNVVLYAHFQDILNTVPMNVQPPDPTFETDLGAGFLMPSGVTHISPQADLAFDREIRLFPTPNLIERLPDGNWRTGDVFGGTGLRLGPGPVVVYAYYSAEATPNGRPGDSAGVMPATSFEARWEVRRHDGGYDTLAEGTSTRFHLVSLPGGAAAYEVRIELRPRAGTVPDCANNLRCSISVRARQVETSVLEASQADLRVRTGPQFPWRVILPLAEPLRDLGLQTAVAGTGHDRLWLRWTVDAALGAFDVDTDSVRLVLRDSEGRPLADLGDPAVVRRSFDHDGAFKPVSFAWTVPLSALPTEAPVHAEAVITNFQGTSTLRHRSEVTWEPWAATNAVPGPETIGAILGVLALAAGRLRARSP